MTIHDLVREGTAALQDAGIEDAEHDAREIYLYLSDSSIGAYLASMRDEADGAQAAEYRRLIRLRADHIPLQQITGTADFLGYSFHVTSAVLIPRFDTETLVLEAEKRLSGVHVFLDLCTGSGCVAVALLRRNIKRFPHLRGIASDLSEDALVLARENIRSNGADQYITAVRSDGFQNIPESFGLIVSNPPYIRTGEIEDLSPEVRDHDPRLALDGGADGLTLYRRFIPDAFDHLLPGGSFLTEIGADQGAEVSALFRESGFSDVEIVKDLSGHDRVVAGQKKG